MAITYNVKWNKAKKLAQGHFSLGHSVQVVVQRLGISEHIIQGWHDDFVIETLQGQAARRIFTREPLLRNAPAAIMVLAGHVKQKGDDKLAYAASSAILSFGSRFLMEDARLQALEDKMKKSTDNDPGLKRSLFDFVSPDQPLGDSKASGKGLTRSEEEELAEVEAAIARLDAANGNEGDTSEEAPPTAERRQPTAQSTDEEEDAETYYRQAGDPRQRKDTFLDVFDGLDDDLLE